MQFCAEKNGWTKFVSMQNHYSLLYRMFLDTERVDYRRLTCQRRGGEGDEQVLPRDWRWLDSSEILSTVKMSKSQELT